MAILITATGKTFDCTFFGNAGNEIVFDIITESRVEADAVFDDPGETRTVYYSADGDMDSITQTATGYTELLLTSRIGEGHFRIMLQRPWEVE